MDISLSGIKGIGPARLKAFEAAGIRTVRELVMFLPREYRDLTHTVPLAALKPGDTAAVRVRVAGEVSERRARRLLITKVYVTDDTDTVQVVWYNQPWLKKQMEPGRELLLYGKAEHRQGYLSLVSPTVEQGQGLIPVYRNIAGIPAKALRQSVEAALKLCEGQWPEELPEALRRRYGLCERNFAMRNAHFPDSVEALEAARRRIAFEELLLYQVALRLFRSAGREGVKIDFDDGALEAFWQRLPFAPTNAQRRVLNEVAADLRSDRAMARMVQGDVGSGKTAIAFAAITLAHAGGWQSALMAPTEVLARQHYEAAKAILEPMGLRVGLLVGSLTPKQHRLAHEAIAAGEWDVAIGTHALITEGVEYKNLGLVVTDEQHRFGVDQRAALRRKGPGADLLAMTATPIPRTLALSLYGDVQRSVIRHRPHPGAGVRTTCLPIERLDLAYGAIREAVDAGRQAYIVCPLADDADEGEELDDVPEAEVSRSQNVRSAASSLRELSRGALRGLRLELLTGRMPAAHKDEVMERFRSGKVDVLVSTTVIEVGVDVPNATVMLVYDADRFGLATLHQLRGRVGRGDCEGQVFLSCAAKKGSPARERLAALERTSDGFELAELDLRLRHEGEVLGYRQHGGGPELKISDLVGDADLVELAHEDALELARRDPELASAELRPLAREVQDRFGAYFEEVERT